MKFLKALIIFVTMFVGGSLFAKLPQGIVASLEQKSLSQRSVAMLHAEDNGQAIQNCMQGAGNRSNLGVAKKLPSPLPVKFHKKYKKYKHKKYKRGKAHLKAFELPSPPSACLVLDSMNLSDVVQMSDFHSLSPLGVPGAVLSSCKRDMSTTMARE